jgi:predicted Zn-dependent peptidase
MSIAYHTLTSGLTVITEHIPSVESAAAHFLIPAGIGHEPESRLGLTAILSEMLLRGTHHRTSRQLADAFDRLGMLRNISAGSQFITLTSSFLGVDAPHCMGLLAELILRPRFERTALEPARALALQSLASLADNPQERAALILSSRHNPRPLDRSPFGTEEGLRAITIEDLSKFWLARCRPRGSILAIAGNFDVPATLKRLDRELTPWLGESSLPELASPRHRGTYHHQPDDGSQVQIYLAHESPAETSPDAPLERITNAVLDAGSSSRLFTEVREKRGLCYSIHAMYATDKRFGRTVIYVGTTPERASESLAVVMEELKKLTGKNASVASEELARAKIGAKRRIVESGESTAARAASLASDYHRLGKSRTLDDLAGESARITLDELNAYVQRRHFDTPTIVSLGPTELKF